MKRLRADLHIHTALSPCCADEMTPPAIVQAAVSAGLDMIAVCDHNAAGNAEATLEAAGSALAVIAGMEITTAEEAHVLGLFPAPSNALAAASEVLATLPDAPESLTRWGEQWLMDREGRMVGKERRLLAAASGLDLAAALDLIHRYSGLAVASHVDRPSFSIPSQLGLIPAEARLEALEISAEGRRRGRDRRFGCLGLPLLCSSDSHHLEEIGGGLTFIRAEAATFEELAMALGRTGGRRVLDA